MALLALAQAARRTLPVRAVDAAEAHELSHGRRITATGTPDGGSSQAEAPVVAAIGPDGDLVALLRDAGGHARPVLVLAAAG